MRLPPAPLADCFGGGANGLPNEGRAADQLLLPRRASRPDSDRRAAGLERVVFLETSGYQWLRFVASTLRVRRSDDTTSTFAWNDWRIRTELITNLQVIMRDRFGTRPTVDLANVREYVRRAQGSSGSKRSTYKTLTAKLGPDDPFRKALLDDVFVNLHKETDDMRAQLEQVDREGAQVVMLWNDHMFDQFALSIQKVWTALCEDRCGKLRSIPAAEEVDRMLQRDEMNAACLWHGGRDLSFLLHGFCFSGLANSRALYGKGTYFSTNGTYSLKFACGYANASTTEGYPLPSGEFHMVLSKVVMGTQRKMREQHGPDRFILEDGGDPVDGGARRPAMPFA